MVLIFLFSRNYKKDEKPINKLSLRLMKHFPDFELTRSCFFLRLYRQYVLHDM